LRWILALGALLVGAACTTPPGERTGGDLTLRVRDAGVQISDRAGHLSVTVRSLDRADHPARVVPGPWTDGRRLEQDLGTGAALWWTDAPGSGLQFGLDLTSRPPGEGPLRITLGVEGREVRVAHDGESASLLGASEPLFVRGLRAWDAEGTELYARFRSERPDELALHVEDEDAVYPLVIDPILSSVATTLSGAPGLAARSGYGLGAADVNGDGYADLLVGEPYFDGVAGADTGRVQLFLGSAGGLASAPVWTFEGTSSFARLGRVLVGLGNTDGLLGEDVAIGVSDADPGGVSGAGSAYVFYALASAPWLSAVPDFVVSGSNISDGCGAAIAADADFDGDGLGDLAVGCPEGHVPGNSSDPGHVVVLYGEPGGFTSSAPDELIPGASSEDELGSAVANAGDVNGDGYDDLLVGAEDFESPALTDDGWVGLYLGGPNGVAASPAATWLSGQDNSALGTQLAGAGDVNGDGYDDVLLGANLWDGDFVNEGRVALHLGSPQGPSPSPAFVWLGGQASAQAAGKEGTVASGGSGMVFGDFDGDGRSDVAASAWRFDGVGSDSGRVEVWSGDADGLAPYPAWTGGGGAALARSGYAMVAADFDGDGDADLALGEWGAGTSDGQVRVLPGPLAGTDTAEVVTVGQGSSSFLGDDRYRITAVTMTQDALLAEAEFRLTVTQPVPVLFTVYEATAPAGPYTQIAQVPATAQPGDSWVGSGPLSVLLQSGRSYYVSTWWQDSATYYNEAESLPAPLGSFGSVIGYRTGSGPPPSSIASAPLTGVVYPTRLTLLPTTDADGDGVYAASDCQDGAASNAPAAAEVCDGLDNDCDGAADFGSAQYELTGSTVLASVGYLKGNRVLAAENRLLTGAEVFLESSLRGPISFGVYEGATATGPWELLDERALVPSTTAPAWHVFSGLGVPLQAGVHYAFVYQWLGGASYTWASGSVHPSWGTHVGGLSDAATSLPRDSAAISSNPSRYQMRLHTSQELDSDGDGSFACLDCDDADGQLFPGQTELCDGLDNDCNGLADADPAGEVNADGDAFRSCAECDDSDPATYPGATELCDGADNDCNGAVPTPELDGDADGVAPCAGDCDDSDPDAFPGNQELCDLADNDCDGLVDDDAALTLVGPAGVPVPATGTVGQTVVALDALADGVITDLNVVLDVTHSWVGDLEVALSSPAMDSALLADNRGGTGAGYFGTVFDDEASTSIGSGAAPFSGSFAPETPLSTFDGERLAGPWTLTLTDTTTGDAGTLDGWQLVASIAGGVDADNDNSMACFDCDEQDPNVYPGAPEICDGVDTDCDGGLLTGEVDADGDGVLLCAGDCDDSDPARTPGAAEICDGIDNNCNGVVPATEADADGDGARVCDGDCDDTRPTIFPGAPELCDGWDNDCLGGLGAAEADVDGDDVFGCAYVATGGNPLFAGGDCDDSSPSVYPGAPEVCDGIDNNCNGTIADEGQDTDGDGESTCTDCDDSDPLRFSGAPERCNALDDDCDGQLGAFETDGDGDLYLTCTFVSSGGNPGYAGGDCDDGDPAINPGAVEACDGLDTDCSGAPGPTEVDGDADGTLLCDDDCDDANPASFPGAAEVCDGLDNDCDGGLPAGEADVDGDGALACSGDCNDGNGLIYPSAPELCDGLDNDCDGQLPAVEADGDGDGQSTCAGDCDDGDPAVATGIPEVCDGVDNNCDGVLLAGEVDGDGDGVAPCLGDCNDALGSVFPGAPELCDGLDDDCDGVVPANEVDADVDGVRVCDGDCDDTLATVFPGAPELCNGLDDDCTPGTTAAGGEGDGDGDGALACVDCDDADPANAPGAPEVCDGIDNDCNGLADLDSAGEVDVDGDGVLSCLDCEDTIAAVAPGLPEVCDGLDNDCDEDTEAPGGESDGDGDQSPACADCDDADAANTPGGAEVCDGQDNDCDPTTEAPGGEVDVDADGAFSCADCDDGDAAVFPGATEACDGLDGDCDGVVPIAEIDGDGDGWRLCDGDCNDSAATVNPAAPEICDGQDNDCDSATNELSDQDLDGFTVCDGDCDDLEPAASPGSPELCDGVDNDCDPATDEALDDDGDGLSECDGDCEDAESTVSPLATEVCDGFDTDCDPATELGAPELDDDGDGSFLCDLEPDCDDDDPTSYPGAPELCDGADNNCDGMFDDAVEDSDGDGFSPCEGDCDDSVQALNPNALEGCDGIDTDCDGVVPDDELDLDDDGAAPCEGDCDDDEPLVGAFDEESACEDGLDNDCDGAVDAEDEDCAVGDDDDASDDDDAAGDDDDIGVDGPDPAGCGCSATTGASGSGGWLLLALGLGLVRRRRASSDRLRSD
jgi:MYXO-CTERM domain-containing protein